jgi:hypothetical protein
MFDCCSCSNCFYEDALCTVEPCKSCSINSNFKEKENDMNTPYPDNFKEAKPLPKCGDPYSDSEREAAAINRNVCFTEATLRLVYNCDSDGEFEIKSIRNFESDLLAKDWLKTCKNQLNDMGLINKKVSVYTDIKTINILIEGKR